MGDGNDVRLLKRTDRPYTSRDAYAALDTSADDADIHAGWIWRTRVPNKVKVFAWLYFKDRLSTRSNLYAKHIVDSVTCELCSRSTEDRHHVFFGCDESLRTWSMLGLSGICGVGDGEIWTASILMALDKNLWPFVLLAILWRIWDARNGHIFRSERFCSRMVLARVRDDLVTWQKRLPFDYVNSLLGWYAHVCDCISNSPPRHG